MDLFEAGEIVKTRGLRGCMKVLSFLETASHFLKPDFIYIEKIPGQKNRFGLKKIEMAGSAFFIEVEEINNVASASALVGAKVYFPKDILQELPPGEYYVHDIVGLDVYNEEGQWLGKIESVFPTGSNDVYVCRGKNKEILLSAVSHVIKKIDVNQRRMTVKIPDGL